MHTHMCYLASSRQHRPNPPIEKGDYANPCCETFMNKMNKVLMKSIFSLK